MRALLTGMREQMGFGRGGLTSYGDAGFSRFIRMASGRHPGFGPEDYEKPVADEGCDLDFLRKA